MSILSPPDRVIKGTNFRAHFTHIHNGYPTGFRRDDSTYTNLGFRVFRNARVCLIFTRENQP